LATVELYSANVQFSMIGQRTGNSGSALTVADPLQLLVGHHVGVCATSSALLIGLLQKLDVELVHLEHGLHDSCRFLGILVLQHCAQDCGDDLP
jgi:hypothetical protein